MAHLLHNCAMKVRANYPDVDELVARVKAVTVENRSRRAFLLPSANLHSRGVAAAPQTPQLGGPGQLWGPKLV